MKEPKEATTNEVVRAYSKRKKRPKLTMMKMGRDTVLIEGTPAALEFLGEFILAHSRANSSDCHNGLSPKGAGNAWFTGESTLGFYLHKLPCPEGTTLATKIRKRKS